MSAPARLAPIRRPARTSLIDDLAAVIGHDAAVRLAVAFAGRQLYVPADVGDDHPIARAIGPAAVAQLCHYYGQATITLPASLARRARIVELDREGVKPPEISARVLCSRGYVFRVLAEERAGAGTGPAAPDDGQIDLFARLDRA